MANKKMSEMTPEERAQCIGMWADVEGFTRPTPIVDVDNAGVDLLYSSAFVGNEVGSFRFHQVTPLSDFPRCWTPEGEPLKGKWVERHLGPGRDQKSWVSEWEKGQ